MTTAGAAWAAHWPLIEVSGLDLDRWCLRLGRLVIGHRQCLCRCMQLSYGGIFFTVGWFGSCRHRQGSSSTGPTSRPLSIGGTSMKSFARTTTSTSPPTSSFAFSQHWCRLPRQVPKGCPRTVPEADDTTFLVTDHQAIGLARLIPTPGAMAASQAMEYSMELWRPSLCLLLNLWIA